MKIKTQFGISIFLFGAVMSAALVLIIITDRQARIATEREALAAGIAQGANELSYLSNDYLIYREDQQVARWQSRFASLLSPVKSLRAETAEEQMLIGNINENARRLQETFGSVLAAAPNLSKNQGTDVGSEFLRISASRLAVQTQGLYSDAQHLSRLIKTQMDRLHENRSLFIYALMGLFGLFLLIIYVLTYLRIIRSMAMLQNGARIIGSGNLDFKIIKERDDEIGEVAAAFNQMSVDLKTVTASKAELEQEIEERQRTEEALRESEEHYRSLFENTVSGIAHCRMIHDEHDHPVDFEYLRVNEQFEKFTGLKDAVGKKVTELIPGILKTNPDLIELYGRVAREGKPEEFEEYLDPLKMWLFISVYSPAKDQFVAVFDVITARKQAEERERKEHEQTAFANRVLRMFVEHEGDELFDQILATVQERMASRHGIFGYIPAPGHLVCPSLTKMLAACEVEGKCIHYPLEKWKGLWARSLIEKRSLFTNQAPPVPPGHPIIYNNLAAPILYQEEAIGLLNLANKEGGYTEEDQRNLDTLASRIAPVLYAWIQRKLREDERQRAETEILQISEDMAARNLELRDANKELEAYIYSVSHDLRGPIRHMAGFAQFLAEDCGDKLDDSGKSYIARIRESSEKTTRLIDDLLRLSRISRQDMQRRETDLSAKAWEVIADLGEASPGRNVEVRVAPGLSAAVDPNLIGVVFTNLLGNALKFSAKTENACIEFGTIKQAGKPVYFVKDNGAGFDQAYCDKMFWPFHRLHADSEFEGTGIGLAIVERVIRRHGGRVWAEGEVGNGASVYFTLG